MRKIRMLASVLAVTLLLSGCSALLEREYSVVEPHSKQYWDSGDSGVLRAEDYQELVNGILTLVAAHTEESVVRLYMPEYSLMETEALLENACREVQTETAAGAYAVDYLTYTVSESAAYREARFTISYRRTAEQYGSIVSVTSSDAVEELLRSAIETGDEELTLRVHYFTATEEEIRMLLQGLDMEKNGEAAGAWTVEIYPAAGQQRILEFFLPQNS